MQVWVVTFYIGGRFGSMIERRRQFAAIFTQEEVRRQMGSYLDRLASKGTAIFPQFDLQLEKIAL